MLSNTDAIPFNIGSLSLVISGSLGFIAGIAGAFLSTAVSGAFHRSASVPVLSAVTVTGGNDFSSVGGCVKAGPFIFA